MAHVARSSLSARAAAPAARRARTCAAYGVFKSEYPEFGTYPGGPGKSPIVPDYDTTGKNAERELIHGRFAMLAVAGVFTQEQFTGIPWYEAGSLCTPDDCSALIDAFPLAIAGQNAPEETGSYYYFGYLLFHEILLMGFAEIFRTGLQPFGEAEKIPNPFPELEGAPKLYPGGRFDPFGMVDKYDEADLKLKEIKHARLAMVAWLGCVFQATVTGEGAYANVTKHLADPTHNNIFTSIGSLY